jgi:glycosyltransferase involved in cell wall biosynthesis
MRVVFCQPTLNRTGSENSLLQMVEGLRGGTNDISLSVLAGEDGVMREDFERLCEVKVIRAPKLRRSFKGMVKFLGSFLTTYRALKREAERGDVVVYVNTLMFPQAAIAGALIRLPVVIHVREVASTYPKGVYSAYSLIAAVCASKIVAACNYVFRQREFPGSLVPETRRAVVYNAARGSETYIKRDLTAAPLRVLAVIPCTVKKGILDLVECIRILRLTLAADVEFAVDIVGRIEETQTHAEVRERLRRYGLENHVHLHGESATVDSFFRSAHVVLHPSHSECFPRVLVEACSFSLPCVATNVGGISEIVVNGRNGYLVSVGAFEEMANRLVLIMTDEHRYAAFSREAHRRFMAMYTIRRLAENCTNILYSSIR